MHLVALLLFDIRGYICLCYDVYLQVLIVGGEQLSSMAWGRRKELGNIESVCAGRCRSTH